MTGHQRAILALAMDRILPSTERGPGATEANAIGYADWITEQSSFGSARGCLEFGLGLLDSIAMAKFERAFVDCGSGERDSILEIIQDTPHPMAQRFFLMLVRLTLAGTFCAPSYGGNRDQLGWKAIGFRPHRLTSL